MTARLKLVPAPPVVSMIVGAEGPLITVNGRAYTPAQLAQLVETAERPAPVDSTNDRATIAAPLPLQVTIAEAATLLGYSRRTIEALLTRGELGSVGTGRARRIPISAIERWQKQNAS